MGSTGTISNGYGREWETKPRLGSADINVRDLFKLDGWTISSTLLFYSFDSPSPRTQFQLRPINLDYVVLGRLISMFSLLL